MQPCAPVCACSPAAAATHSVRPLETWHRIRGKKVLLVVRTMRIISTAAPAWGQCGVPACGDQARTPPGKGLPALNDDDDAPVTPAPGHGARNPVTGPGQPQPAVARPWASPRPARAGRLTGWGTLASWTLMWW